jgi:hypothetical protein
MPADSIHAAHSPLTETSAHPVSKSSLKEDYTIPCPLKTVYLGCRDECRASPFRTAAEPPPPGRISARVPRLWTTADTNDGG